MNTEINLALALQNHSDVVSVDFETIWNQGHTEAEDSGSASSNFISWVESCTEGTGIGEHTLESPVEDGIIYTIDGRRIGTTLPDNFRGVYIQNGKKHVKMD